MLEGIKDACVFLIVAQVLMILVPEETYAKYVRVLIAVILIFKITQPVCEFAAGMQKKDFFVQRMEQMERNLYDPGSDEEMILNKQQLYQKVIAYMEQEEDAK